MPTHRNPLRRLRAAVAGSAALVLAACAVNPATGERQLSMLPASQEAQLGAQEHPKVVAQFGGEYKDREVQAFVDRVGRKLAVVTEQPDITWTFTVLDSDVVNAFALPGGFVYVTRALLALAEDEAEVAGVLAHEIGHITARHTAQRMTRSTIAGVLAAGVGLVLGSADVANLAGVGAGAVLAGYSRGQELEADELAIRYLTAAGYDPFAMATFLETMRRNDQYQEARTGRQSKGNDFFASHPRTEDRVEKAAELARNAPKGGARPVDAYHAAADGMIYGDSPDNGYVRGNQFLHPALGFGFQVPEGFSLLNGAQQVIAKGPNGAAVVFDAAPMQGARNPAEYLAGVWGREARIADAQRIDVNGLPAATAVTRGQTESGAVDIRLVAIQWDADTVFRFTFLSPPGALRRYDQAFEQTAMSFRRLTRAEVAGLQPRRIRVVTVRGGETVESLVARMPQEPYAEELFRIINDLPPGTPLQPGRRVKIITG